MVYDGPGMVYYGSRTVYYGSRTVYYGSGTTGPVLRVRYSGYYGSGTAGTTGPGSVLDPIVIKDPVLKGSYSGSCHSVLEV